VNESIPVAGTDQRIGVTQKLDLRPWTHELGFPCILVGEKDILDYGIAVLFVEDHLRQRYRVGDSCKTMSVSTS